MISGRNPWRYANTEDSSFSAYLQDPNFLRFVLPISQGANRILNRIFTLNPFCRITLPELRTEILKLDTFFMTKDELANAPEHVKTAANAYGARRPSFEIALSGAYDDDSPSDTDSEDSASLADSDDFYIHTRIKEFGSIDAARSGGFDVSLCQSVDIADFSIGVASSSGSSEEGSDGPITPETIATHPRIAVPDFPDGENLGEPVSDQLLAGKKQPPANLFTTLLQYDRIRARA